MSTKELTTEEKAFFETGGASDMPADYLPKADDQAATQPDDDAAAYSADGAADDIPAKAADNGGDEGGDPANRADADQAKREMVPLATYMEEKKARQERDRRLEAINAQMLEQQANLARGNERLTQILEHNARQEAAKNAPPPVAIPTFDDDPMAAGKWTQERLIEMENERQRQVNAYHQTQHQQSQRQQYEAAVVSAYVQSAEQVRQAEPTFNDAHTFLVNQRVKEIRATGKTEEQAWAQVRQDEFTFAADALQNRQNPAAMLYQVALARGFTPAQAQPAAAAANLDAVSRGQAANVSLSTAGSSGNARSGKLDMKSLGEMSDKEFAAFLSKDKDGDAWKKAMGG